MPNMRPELRELSKVYKINIILCSDPISTYLTIQIESYAHLM